MVFVIGAVMYWHFQLTWILLAAWWPETLENRYLFWRPVMQSRLLTVHPTFPSHTTISNLISLEPVIGSTNKTKETTDRKFVQEIAIALRTHVKKLITLNGGTTGC